MNLFYSSFFTLTTFLPSFGLTQALPLAFYRFINQSPFEMGKATKAGGRKRSQL